LRARRPNDVVLLAAAGRDLLLRATRDVVNPDLLLAAFVRDERELATIRRVLFAAIAPRGVRHLRPFANTLLRWHDHDLAMVVHGHVIARRRDTEALRSAL